MGIPCRLQCPDKRVMIVDLDYVLGVNAAVVGSMEGVGTLSSSHVYRCPVLDLLGKEIELGEQDCRLDGIQPAVDADEG